MLFFSCCSFIVNTSNRSISLLRILFDYLILALALYIDSRPNVLVVLHHGKLSFFFRYTKRFLPSLHLFTFDTWMNEHQIGWSLFVGFFSLEYRGLCLHSNSSNNGCKIKKTTLQHRPDYLFYWLTFIYLLIQISFNRIESSARSSVFFLLNLNNHYVIVLTTIRKSFVKSTRLMEIKYFFLRLMPGNRHCDVGTELLLKRKVIFCVLLWNEIKSKTASNIHTLNGLVWNNVG